MTDYTKIAASFTALQGGDADPAVFDTEFDSLETVSATKADKADPTFTGTVVVPAAAGATSPYQKSEVDAAFAPLASPALTGTPTAPTAAPATSTTQVATTAFVTTADNLKANLASPALTGTPTAPTAAVATDTTQVATTAYVKNTTQSRVLSAQFTPTVSSTAYTNNTDSDLIYYIRMNFTAVGEALGYINGEVVHRSTANPTGYYSFSLTVPAGATYGHGNTGTVSAHAAWTVKNNY